MEARRIGCFASPPLMRSAIVSTVVIDRPNILAVLVRIEIIFAMQKSQSAHLGRATERLVLYPSMPTSPAFVWQTFVFFFFFSFRVLRNRSPLSKWSAVLCTTYFLLGSYRELLMYIIAKSIYPRIRKWVWVPGPGDSSAVTERYVSQSKENWVLSILLNSIIPYMGH